MWQLWKDHNQQIGVNCLVCLDKLSLQKKPECESEWHNSACIYSPFHQKTAFQPSWVRTTCRTARTCLRRQKDCRRDHMHAHTRTHTHADPVDESRETILTVWQLTRKMTRDRCLRALMGKTINTVQYEIKWQETRCKKWPEILAIKKQVPEMSLPVQSLMSSDKDA